MKQRVYRRVLLIGCAVVMAAFTDAAAQAAPVIVRADFTGGDGTSIPDAYVGTGGNGWTSAWGQATYNNGTVSGTVLESGETGFTPLNDGGNHLQTSVTRGDKDNFYGVVGRIYGAGIDTASDHTIRFKYRIDESISGVDTTFTTSADKYDIFGYNSVYRSTTSANPWQITGDASSGPRTWRVCNGADTAVDTGLLLQPDVVYDFRIDVRPVTKTWDVRIENLTTSAVYDSTTSGYGNGLAWRGNNSATTLNFHARGGTAADVREFSVDAISITGVDLNPYGGMNRVAAHFSGGNTDALVDGYVGKPGDGWKTAWGAVSGYSPISAPPTVLSPPDAEFDEIKPGLGSGSYLKVVADGEGGTTSPYQGVGRDYKANAAPGIDWTQPHSIQFTVRIDEDVDDESLFLGAEDRYAIFDRESLAGATDSHFRWAIIASGKDTSGASYDPAIAGEWTFYDGDKSGTWDSSYMCDTDVALRTGHVYDFTILVDPADQSYDATVTDVTDPEHLVSRTVRNLGWRSTATDIGGVVNFTARDDYHTSGDARAFSLDEVTITAVPEPSMTALLLAALAAIVSTARVGRRS